MFLREIPESYKGDFLVATKAFINEYLVGSVNNFV